MENNTSEQTDDNQKSYGDRDLRIQKIRRKRWVNYPTVMRILKRLEIFYNRSRDDRMPSMLVYGGSGMGKTMLAKKFLSMHTGSFDRENGVSIMPIIYVEVPPAVNDERDFYIEILSSIGAPLPWSARPAQLRELIKQVLREIGCKILLIDETNNLLSGTSRQLRVMLNSLRYLSNRTQISLVCFGINSTLNIISGDEQLANRMESYNLAPLVDKKMLMKFVTEIVNHYPLYKDSNFKDDELLREILMRTKGVLGRIMPMIQEAAIFSVENGIEKIDIDVIKNIDKQPQLVSMATRNRDSI